MQKQDVQMGQNEDDEATARSLHIIVCLKAEMMLLCVLGVQGRENTYAQKPLALNCALTVQSYLLTLQPMKAKVSLLHLPFQGS